MSFFCKAPWTSIAFQPSGKAGPCCVYDLDSLKEVTTPVENTFAQEREDFLNGNLPAGCKKCHHSFQEIGKSYANSFDHYKVDTNKVAIQEINVKSNNICNLACRSCGTHFSSKWEEEFGTPILITKDNVILEKLKLIDLQTLQMVVIAGGEPTLTQEHVDTLQMLIDAKKTDVDIRISTNLTSLKYKQLDLVSLWKNFPKLYLQLSIDGVEDRAKNIRSGTDWDVVGNNLKTIINSGIPYYINITVSALNIWFLEETIMHLKTNFGVDKISFNILFEPDILSVQVIPPEYRKEINQMLDKCIESGHDLAKVKTYFNSTDNQHLWPHFLIYNLMLDHSRKETFFDLLPIKRDLINRWVKL